MGIFFPSWFIRHVLTRCQKSLCDLENVWGWRRKRFVAAEILLYSRGYKSAARCHFINGRRVASKWDAPTVTSRAILLSGTAILSVCVCPRHYRLRIQWVSGWFLHEAARTEQNKLWRCSSVKLFVAVHIFHVFILFAALAYNPRRPLSSKNSQRVKPPDVNLLVFIFFLSFFIFW